LVAETFVRLIFVIVADAVRSSEEETTPDPDTENLLELFTWKFTKSPKKELVTLIPIYVPEGFALPNVDDPIWIKAVLEDCGTLPDKARAVTPVPVRPKVDPVALVKVTVAKLERPLMLRDAPWR